MAPSNNFYTSSPTVVLPANIPNPCIAGAHYAQQTITQNNFPNASTFLSSQAIASTHGSLAGRKRSRGDVDAPEDGTDTLEDGSVRTPPTDEYEQPLGKHSPEVGMMIDSNGPASSDSNFGTLGIEHSERGPVNSASIIRPSVTSRKSQRMGSASSGGDDLAQLVLPPQMRDVTAEPLIDEATRTLGISWTRMDSSEALRINQAAYGKWIQNHYPGLKEVTIWFENSAIPGYLVAALNAYNSQHEYYIFSHDLTEARLVTSEPSQLIPRLKMLPALHLAAPGGCIRAEADSTATAPIVLTGNGIADSNSMEYKNQQTSDPVDDNVGSLSPEHMCTAHAMEMD